MTCLAPASFTHTHSHTPAMANTHQNDLPCACEFYTHARSAVTGPKPPCFVALAGHQCHLFCNCFFSVLFSVLLPFPFALLPPAPTWPATVRRSVRSGRQAAGSGTARPRRCRRDRGRRR